MYREVLAARKRAEAGDGPTFIEALTYRYHGHNTGEVTTYQLAPGQTIEPRPMVILRPKHGIRMTFTEAITHDVNRLYDCLP